MSIVRQSRGGRENDSNFGTRFKGEGVFADMIAQRFKKTCARLGLNARHYALDTLRSKRIRPAIAIGTAKNSSIDAPENGSGSGPQMSLF